eukprot:g4633.t1
MRKSGHGGVKHGALAMRDTEWEDSDGEMHVQKLVWERAGGPAGKRHEEGDPKGLLRVGYERVLWDAEGVSVTLRPDGKALSKEQMVNKLTTQPDFAAVATLLEDLHRELGIDMQYAPKFHCETQEMVERSWAHSKADVRQSCDYSIVSLRKSVPRALSGIPVELFRKWQRSEMAWERAYREGATMLDVHAKVKEIKERTYKSHRVLLAEVDAEPRARKAQFKATTKQRWDAAEAGVTMKLVPAPEQAGWPAKRQLVLDTDDNTVHRITHVGWHDKQQCVVA